MLIKQSLQTVTMDLSILHAAETQQTNQAAYGV